MIERFVSVGGSHADIGFQLGKTCRDGIRLALKHLGAELSEFMSGDAARKRAEAYAPIIESRAAHLLQEIEGLADGAGITVADALILQLRFELIGFDGHGGEGCSSFAISDGGIRLTGQNVDAPIWHKELGMVVEMRTPNGPDLLMYTYYPGMIGYLGINSAGLSVFGNAVLSPGWRVGFPRYLAIRLALEQESVADVHAAMAGLERASTINLVTTDATHAMIDLELDVHEIGVVEPTGARIFHTNHYLCPALQDKERLLELLPDSLPRFTVGSEKLNNMTFAADRASAIDQAKDLLRDHTNGPSSICRHGARESVYAGDQWESVASIVADPDGGRMHVSFGNPCELPYQEFGFSDSGETLTTASRSATGGVGAR